MGQTQHTGQVPLQDDTQLIAVGFEGDFVDQFSDGFAGSGQGPVVTFLCVTQTADFLAIQIRHARMHERRGIGLFDLARELTLFPFERNELVLDRQRGNTVFDRVDELSDFAFVPRLC
jgi:hypothetical protein